MKLRVMFICFVGFLCVLSVEGRRKYTRARGRVFCQINGRAYPVPYAKVSLLDKDLIGHGTFGRSRTSWSGYFTVSGRAGDLWGNPDPYIQIEYQYSGYYGKMDVENAIGINRRDKTSVKRYSRYLNFGNIYFSGDSCRAYVNTFLAMKHFRVNTRLSLPYRKLRVVTRALFHGGTPYATRNKIRIPRGYNYNLRTAEHEFAHTIRHTLDGSFLHFLGDVIRYKYAQHHNCGKVTNPGFAFNEGWAQFWAGDCRGYTGTNYRVEGNVASALNRLKNRCQSSYGKMVTVLRRNRGRIHSYIQFARAHRRMYGCS